MNSKSHWWRQIGNVLIVAALGIFAWLAWLLWGTDLAASHQQERLVTEVRQDLATKTAVPGTPLGEDPVIRAELPAPGEYPAEDAMTVTAQPESDEPAASAEVPSPIEGQPGEAFGVITVPRFGVEYEMPLLFATDTETLQHGVGHYEGTGPPCVVGNFALAGHRTTYGRPFHDIDRLQPGDEIVIETLYGSCVYEVDSHEIVDASAVHVIAPVPGRPGEVPTESWLTMTACHPKYSAAERYIVYARLVETN